MSNFIGYPQLDQSEQALIEWSSQLIRALEERDISTVVGPVALGYQVTGTVSAGDAVFDADLYEVTAVAKTLGKLLTDLKASGVLG